MRRLASAAGVCAAVSVVVAACGGSGTAQKRVSEDTAVRKLYHAIEARPSWATAQEVAAAGAASTYAAGSNVRCGYYPQGAGEVQEHFVCSLRYRDTNGQTHAFLLTETATGAGVAPATRAELTAVEAYERTHIPKLAAAYKRSHPSLFKGAKTIAGALARQTAAQPRVKGTACGGAYGLSDATPAASVLMPGNYLVAGGQTSCNLAQVVATALGDSQKPASAVLTVPDAATGKRLTLRCHGMSSFGPLECVGGSATVYLGSDEPPLRPAG